ncbi:hypothetical protein [Shouchella lehensis]|uniref:Uncharacterized protein n=1 Tax=Shouchella lehensis TaxID=300825 RepID=A0A4Y7WJL9_9BACI|nr:hypothetical protein [Shouchella lehensis]MBG9786013.1 hypothetical protein [Shouchella lehensis]TES48492.1 hypothetical protein E2L03_15410 [Shouchella lehensis]
MAEHLHFEKERKQINAFLAEGLKIDTIIDHLNGSDISFSNDQKYESLTVGNANARKYASTLFFHQQKGGDASP